jgi:hypothetical protein
MDGQIAAGRQAAIADCYVLRRAAMLEEDGFHLSVIRRERDNGIALAEVDADRHGGRGARHGKLSVERKGADN